MNNLQKILKNTKLQLFIIIFLTFLAYSNIFQNDFVGDDFVFIVNWQDAHNLSFIPQLFTGATAYDTKVGYRPVRSTILTIIYQFSGLNPYGYHLFAIIEHLTITALVFGIVKLITKSKLLSFVSSLLFGLHPIHTEAVTEMITSLDSAGFLFFFASIYTYLKSYSGKKTKNAKMFYRFSILFAGLAFFSNEFTITLPVVIGLVDFYFKRKGMSKSELTLVFKKILPYLVILGVYLFIRVGLLQIGTKGGFIDNSFYITFFVAVLVFIKYIQLLVVPVNLSMNHEILPGVYSWIDEFTNMDKLRSLSLSDPRVMLGMGGVALLAIIALKTFKKSPLISFSIFWFFITSLPISNLIPIGTVMQERYIYLASFGYVLLLALGINWLWNLTADKYQKYAICSLLLIIAGFYFIQTYRRNMDFKDQVTFSSVTASQIPNNIIANFTTGVAYQETGQDEKAITYYKKTIQLQPFLINSYIKLAEIYQKQGQIDEAIKNYKIVLSLTPNDLSTRKKLLEIYESNPQFSEKISE